MIYCSEFSENLNKEIDIDVNLVDRSIFHPKTFFYNIMRVTQFTSIGNFLWTIIKHFLIIIIFLFIEIFIISLILIPIYKKGPWRALGSIWNYKSNLLRSTYCTILYIILFIFIWIIYGLYNQSKIGEFYKTEVSYFSPRAIWLVYKKIKKDSGWLKTFLFLWINFTLNVIWIVFLIIAITRRPWNDVYLNYIYGCVGFTLAVLLYIFHPRWYSNDLDKKYVGGKEFEVIFNEQMKIRKRIERKNKIRLKKQKRNEEYEKENNNNNAKDNNNE